MLKNKERSVHYAPCKAACPILTDAREYIQLIAERRFPEAFASIRGLNPLPRIVGRICTHPCETNCKRGQLEAPIAIAALKRFASDGAWADQVWKPRIAGPTGHKVAVIGSGPAGLSAAHDLAVRGHQVTIFEALPVLGGMLRVGVPEYRLPKAVVDAEIKAVLDLGVMVKTEVKVGKDLKPSDLSDQGFEAVFVAIGAHEDRKLGIPGEDDLEGVFSAVAFLRAVNMHDRPPVGGKVAVIGGGNTAIDSARSVLRMGAESVSLLYRRSREEMPASPEEVEEAGEEGVDISYLTAPIEIRGENGRVVGLTCIRNELGEPDAGGRRRPVPVAGSEYTLDVQTVICAIGQIPQSGLFAEDFEIAERGKRIHVAEDGSLITSQSPFFAGGDAVTGPATVIRAIGAGKQAAVSIDAFLQGEPIPKVNMGESGQTPRLPEAIIEKSKQFDRCGRPTLDVAERLEGFEEVESCLSEHAATREALRCLHCYLGARIDPDKCISCLTCVRVCPLGIPEANQMGEVVIDPVECQACGLCVVECPVRAIDIGFNRRSKMFKEMEAAAATTEEGAATLVGFVDLYGNFSAADMTQLKQDYPNILPVPVFGLRRLDTVDIFKAFGLGAAGVFLARAPGETDPFPETAGRVDRVVNYTHELLASLGKKPEQLALCDMPSEGIIDHAWFEDWLKQIG